jgi:hypothetical protein
LCCGGGGGEGLRGSHCGYGGTVGVACLIFCLINIYLYIPVI